MSDKATLVVVLVLLFACIVSALAFFHLVDTTEPTLREQEAQRQRQEDDRLRETIRKIVREEFRNQL